MMVSKDLDQLKSMIAEFAAARDWQQFHTPKNLAVSLSIEAAELLEIFQWLTPEQSLALDEVKRENLRDEVGDVLIYLVNLCTKLGIDPYEAAFQKMAKNAAKYPVDKAKGLAKKYTEL
jgi:NTP pyrophosphatase (non-canonical NTP hydrolase)